MKRLPVPAVLPVLAMATSLLSPAQMTTVTATQLRMDGVPVRQGTVGFTPVNAQGSPTAIRLGGKLYASQAFTATIADGAIAPLEVPDLAQAIPVTPNAELRYSVQIYNADKKQATTLKNVSGVSGLTWALDQYAAAAKLSSTPASSRMISVEQVTLAQNKLKKPVAPGTVDIGSSGGNVGSTSALSLGQNADLNGFKPFCPAADRCSAIYSDISSAPIDAVHNQAFQNYYGVNRLHPDFIDDADTLPYYVLNTQSGTGITYVPSHCTANLKGYCTESDDTLLPFKSGMKQEGGTDPLTNYADDGKDHHLSIIDQATGFMYDTYQAKNVGGIEQLYASSLWDLNSPIEGQHPLGRTSADAAGLPVGLGLTVRYEDILAGHIDHALRVTLDLTGCSFYDNGDGHGAFVSPASHAACTGGSTPAPGYMGMRLRLRPDFDISGYSQQNQVILKALKRYGFIVADNGGKMFFQGTYDPRFDQDDLNNLKQIRANDFQVVSTGKPINTAELSPEDASGGTSVVTDQTGLDSVSKKGTALPIGPLPAIDRFSASSTTVLLGSQVTFSASGSNASYGFIDNAGPIRMGSSVTITPAQTTTYTLTVLGPNGYAASNPIKVTVIGPTAVAPVASLTPGSYTSAQSVALATATTGAAIHLTTDGSVPACNSSIYTGPMQITGVVTISALSCKAGSLPSPVSTFTYKVHVPGSVPSVVNQSTSGVVEYASAISVPLAFTSGDGAVVTIVRTSDSSVASVTCGAAAGTLVRSQVTTAGGTPTWMQDVYYVPSATSGAQSCNVTYAGKTIRSRVFVSEIVGASGVEAVDSSNISTAYHGGSFRCGTLTTTGPNRLGLVAGMQAYAAPVAASGYTQLFATADNALAALAIPDAATQNLLINSQYTENYSCISLALKP